MLMLMFRKKATKILFLIRECRDQIVETKIKYQTLFKNIKDMVDIEVAIVEDDYQRIELQSFKQAILKAEASALGILSEALYYIGSTITILTMNPISAVFYVGFEVMTCVHMWKIL